MYEMCAYLRLAELAKASSLPGSFDEGTSEERPSELESTCRDWMCMRCLARHRPTLARSRGALRACRSAHVGGHFMFLMPLYEAI